MKKLCISLIAFLAFALAIKPGAQAEEKAVEGQISVGAAITMDDIDNDEDGAVGLGAEYNSIIEKDRTWDLSGDLSLRSSQLSLDAEGHYQDGDDQEYGAAASFGRILNYETDYNRFFHRLGHDELSNLMAHIFKNTDGTAENPATPAGFGISSLGPAATVGSAAVYHTDHDPEAEYGVTYSVWNNSLKVNIPQFPGLKIGLDYRSQTRKGCDQARTMSKCSACHIEGFSKSVDETTRDFMPKVGFTIGSLALEYSFLHREFEEDSEDMLNTYNNLAAPKHVKLFSDRLQFDGTNGPLPFNRMPESTKDTHTVKARWDLNNRNTVTAAFVYSKSTNESVDHPYNVLLGQFGEELELESTTVTGKWHSRLSKGLSLTLHGKYQTLDNDEPFVDVVDRANLTTGAVLGDKYGVGAGFWDFERKSGYDLDITSIGLDVAWRLMHGLTIRGGYEFHYEDRENAEYHHVPDDTTAHKFKISADWRLNHDLRFSFGYKLALIDDAYALHKAMCTPNNSFGGYAGPKTDLYTFERSYRPTVYEERVAERTNQPDTIHELSFKTNWSPFSLVSTNFYAKYRHAENGEIDGRDWQQDLFNGGLNLVFNMGEKALFSAGYNYFNDKTESVYCIAIYDG